MQAPLKAKNDSDAVQTETARTARQEQRFVDNRPAAVAQRKLAEMLNNSARVSQQRALSDAMHNSARMVAQRHEMKALFGGAVRPQGDGAMPAGLSPAQRAENPNNTGLPKQLKSGMESLSGMSMDHVKVHYNSDRPAQLQAHAYAQGSEIHLGAGQERHLPHEAWHIVQQAQGRVRPTLQMKAGAVNDDPSLEKEADMMGEKAARFEGGHASDAVAQAASIPDQRQVALVQRQLATLKAQGPRAAILQRYASGAATGVIQLLDVLDEDVGSDFNIILPNGDEAVGTLREIRGGGWFLFEVDGENVRIRGRDSIVSAADDAPGGGEDDYYNEDMLDAEENEFDVEAIAKAEDISVREVLLRLRNRFRDNPETLRVHYPFGSKTIAKGGGAYRDPQEDELEPQASVSYRQGDYKKHKKVGKDYDDWADQLSDDDESETDKRERAGNILDFLEGEDLPDFGDLEEGQKAALGGLVSVGLISDPLRTEYDSTRTERDFFEQLRARQNGDISFHDMFGSKANSTFLPARSGGSGQQRERLRFLGDIRDEDLLWANNCLINAICGALGRGNATEDELLAIRYNLENVGEMLLATPAVVGVIRNVLDTNRRVVIHYPDPALPNETIHGILPMLHIYHTGGNHFTNVCPDHSQYH